MASNTAGDRTPGSVSEPKLSATDRRNRGIYLREFLPAIIESLALGFGVMILASLVFGFLGVVGVALTWSGWIIFGAGMLTWGVTLGLRAS